MTDLIKVLYNLIFADWLTILLLKISSKTRYGNALFPAVILLPISYFSSESSLTAMQLSVDSLELSVIQLLSTKLDFSEIISEFALLKARKVKF